MKEREINLIDLMIEILLHWRGIVILMLAGGVLLGAFSYVRTSQSAKEQAARIEELKAQLEEGPEEGTEGNIKLKDAIKGWMDNEEINLEESMAKWLNVNSSELEEAVKKQLEKELTETQRNNVEYALYYEELHRDKEAYQEASVYTRMDPEKIQRAEMTFLVSSDDLERSYNLERIYEDMANNVELLTMLADIADVPVANVGEVYSLSRGSGGLMKGSDSFRVTMTHYDKAVCQKMAQAIVDFLNSRHDSMAAQLGEHEISVVSQTVGEVGISSVLTAQRNMVSELLSLESSIARTKGAFTDEEWYYYNLLTTGKVAGNPYAVKVSEEEAAEAEEGEEDIMSIINAGVTVTPRISVKYVILGMILAAFVYVFAIFMLYVLNSKIRSTDNLQELYEIPQLGKIPGDAGGKKLFGFVDRWILALRYWNQRKFTPKEALDLAAVAVKMAAGKNALKTVSLVGCDLKDRALNTCEEIRMVLAEEGVEAQILNNVLYDAETMEKLGDTKGAVLVEKADSTLYAEVARELELLRRQDIAILGGIIVE
jgi:hypothetical protein